MIAFLFFVVFFLVLYVWSLSDKVKLLQESYRRLEDRFFESRKRFSEDSSSTPLRKPEMPPQSAPVLTPSPVIPPPIVTPPPTPRPIPPPLPLRAAAAAVPPQKIIRTPDFSMPNINWEQFMGVKLFAWLGGFALFLGMCFFVKYSIDHNWISPLMRVTIGFVIGVGVILAGLSMNRKNYAVTVQTFCAAGIAVLYADIFACRSIYAFLTPVAAFPLMVGVTAAAFLLAVRLDSRYVAILGLIGGFLTPIMLSTGDDRPIALFTYLALLDVGVIAVSLRKRWGFLVGMSAAATFLMEVGWTAKFLSAHNGTIAFGIYAGMCVLYLIAAEIAEGRKFSEFEVYAPAALMALVSMGFVAYMQTLSSLGTHPGLVLTLLLLLSVQLAYMAVRFEQTRPFYVLGGSVAFVILLLWTTSHLKTELLTWGLAYYMAFAIVHAALPILLQRLKPSSSPFLWGYVSPILMLVLIVIAMLCCDVLSFAVWPAIFLIGMLAVAVAWIAGSILAAGATLLLIMGSFGIWLFRLPDVAGLGGILMLLAFFACAFFAWSLLVTRKNSLFSGNAALSMARGIDPSDAMLLPAFSALMPFALMALVCLKLKLADPSPAFGLMLLMNILLLALVRYRTIDAVSILALLATAAVEFTWHQSHFNPQTPMVTLWYVGFALLFGLFPFVFSKRLKGTLPWVASALSGPVHFGLVYNATTQVVGHGSIGLVPAVFGACTLLGLYAIIQYVPKTDSRWNSLVAWHGGVALFFITLIIPIQFDKEWITLGWALEGAALTWLFQRVPHKGLKAVGVALLLTAFVRLTMNPAVFSYHPRTSAAILNWYLFVYGAAAASTFAAAKFLKAPRNWLLDTDMPPLLNSLGTILTFILLNIEVADFYSTGSTITFNFLSSSFAQDLTYSLVWATFGTALLIIGIGTRSTGARYASLGLITVTIIKVFLHDLWRLGQLYRVASFVGLAVFLILISFLYQKFVSDAKPQEVRHG